MKRKWSKNTVSHISLVYFPQLQSFYKADSGRGLSPVSVCCVRPLWATRTHHQQQQQQELSILWPHVCYVILHVNGWWTGWHPDSRGSHPVSGAQSQTREMQVNIQRRLVLNAAFTHLFLKILCFRKTAVNIYYVDINITL